MNLSQWKTAAQTNLRRLAGTLRRAAPNALYGFLSAATLLPVVTASQQAMAQGDLAVVLAIGGLLKDLGVNLVAGEIQAWKARTEAELAPELQTHAAADPAWREALDRLLNEFEAAPTAAAALAADDRTWFEETLRGELQRLGSRVRYEATAQGQDIAQAQGPGAQAASGGSVVARTIYGNVTVNPPPAKPDPEVPRRQYLMELRKWCQNLPLAALGSDERTENSVTLDQVYIALDTQTRVPLTEAEKAKRQEESALLLRGDDRDSRSLSALEAASAHARLVLLGAPGAGKSTFARKLAAWQAAAQAGEADPPPAIPHDLLPVFIVLRHLAPRLAALTLADEPAERQKKLLIDAVKAQVRDDLDALDAGDFADALLQEVKAGRCLLILDGLDEVPHDLRATVRQAVGALLQRWRPQRMLVTCRIRSYAGDALLPDFQAHTLAPLDEPRIKQFAHAWYDAQVTLRHLIPEQAARKADDLAEAAISPELSELAQNPMMLTAMAIIHQKEIGLPRQRVCLYKEVVEVLLRRWQKEKVGEKALVPSPGLREVLLDNRRLLPLVQRLAYAAHQAQRQGNADLPRPDALQLLEQDQYLGSSAQAEEFLDYVDQRAGLLVGQGGDLRHPTTYNFPHRTFQEYLAGCYLISQREPERALFDHAAEGDDWGFAARLGIEELLYNRLSDNAVLDLAYQLCPPTLASTPQAQRAILWAAAAVDRIGQEAVRRDTGPGGGQAFLDRLAPAVRRLLTVDLTPAERAEAGRTLARLGDPRPEALTIEGMQFCAVPAGPFWMGSGDDPDARDDEKPLHQVEIPYDFWIGRYPVTNAQFAEFTAAGGYAQARYWPEAQKAGYWRDEGFRNWRPDEYRQGLPDLPEPFNLPNHPAAGVSWYEALAFTRWLSERLAGQLPAGWAVRLPGEAEWEKAARGGTQIPLAAQSRTLAAGLAAPAPPQPNPQARRRFPWGDETDTNRANSAESGIGATSAVGCFPGGASPYGVEELSGNVWEWTRSLWGPDYQKPRYGYPYVAGDGRENLAAGANELRVLRGGSYYANRTSVRCALRFGFDPGLWSVYWGFRVVVSP